MARGPSSLTSASYVHCRDDLQDIGFAHNHLTSDEARRIANGIARLPEFMMQRKDFHQRGDAHSPWTTNKKPPAEANKLFITQLPLEPIYVHRS
jgi:hypothetical protein